MGAPRSQGGTPASAGFPYGRSRARFKAAAQHRPTRYQHTRESKRARDGIESPPSGTTRRHPRDAGGPPSSSGARQTPSRDEQSREAQSRF